MRYKKDKNFLNWYDEIIKETRLAVHGPVKGTLFLAPLVVQIWENIQIFFNQNFQKLEVKNVLFPAIFPQDLLLKEKAHFSGFNPEVYKVLKPGQKLDRNSLILRPTSEILFNLYFKKVLRNSSQLPIKLNQWSNVYRYEKNPKPFLRNNEFYWQEGHALFENNDQSEDFAKKVSDLYLFFFKNILAISPFSGFKTELEKFSGADKTYGFEVILEDGQFLQIATVHNFLTNFSRSFDVKVQNQGNNYFYPFGLSWGLSTRVIGALIALHSDDHGLVLPPQISPYKFAIIAFSWENEVLKLIDKIINLFKKLSISFIFEKNIKKSPSWIKHNYILNGVPIILEIGNNEVKSQTISIIKRHNFQALSLHINKFSSLYINNLLNEVNEEMYKQQLIFQTNKLKEIKSIDDLKKSIANNQGGKCYFCLNNDNEINLKKNFQITIRIILYKANFKDKKCFFTQKQANSLIIIGRAY